MKVKRFKIGDRVVITRDLDGAANLRGTVEHVFKSGRCQVLVDDGHGLRNIAPENMRAVSDR